MPMRYPPIDREPPYEPPHGPSQLVVINVVDWNIEVPPAGVVRVTATVQNISNSSIKTRVALAANAQTRKRGIIQLGKFFDKMYVLAPGSAERFTAEVQVPRYVEPGDTINIEIVALPPHGYGEPYAYRTITSNVVAETKEKEEGEGILSLIGKYWYYLAIAGALILVILLLKGREPKYERIEEIMEG